MKPKILLVGLALIAFVLSRRRSQHLQGAQKLFGVIAVISTVLILLQPELLALGLLGDTTFFDMLVLALTLQMHTYAVQMTRMVVSVLSRTARWLGLPSPGFSYMLAVLRLGMAGGVSPLRRRE